MTSCSFFTHILLLSVNQLFISITHTNVMKLGLFIIIQNQLFSKRNDILQRKMRSLLSVVEHSTLSKLFSLSTFSQHFCFSLYVSFAFLGVFMGIK